MAMLMTKKTLTKFGTKLNESAGSNVSDFARRQMEKFGWSEGKGLGKNEDGMAGHIKAKKREESAGLGSETVAVEVAADDWWHHGFTNALKKVPSDKSKKKKKKSKEKVKGEKTDAKPPTFDELFAATGGKRLGMRARGSQKGKLARTLDGGNVETGVVNGMASGGEAPTKGRVHLDVTKESSGEVEGAPAKKTTKAKRKRKEKDGEEREDEKGEREVRSGKKSKKSCR